MRFILNHEIFELNGQKVKCIEYSYKTFHKCIYCYMKHLNIHCYSEFNCADFNRKSNRTALFKKI